VFGRTLLSINEGRLYARALGGVATKTTHPRGGAAQDFNPEGDLSNCPKWRKEGQ